MPPKVFEAHIGCQKCNTQQWHSPLLGTNNVTHSGSGPLLGHTKNVTQYWIDAGPLLELMNMLNT